MQAKQNYCQFTITKILLCLSITAFKQFSQFAFSCSATTKNTDSNVLYNADTTHSLLVLLIGTDTTQLNINNISSSTNTIIHTLF